MMVLIFAAGPTRRVPNCFVRSRSATSRCRLAGAAISLRCQGCGAPAMESVQSCLAV